MIQGPINILVLGSGGREHAICRKLKDSKNVNQVFAIPGNPGMSEHAHCFNEDPNNFDRLIDLVKENKIDLTIVGPENLLEKGVVDRFQRESLPIIGPTQKAAQLETSKVFCKDFCREFNIPSAEYKTFTQKEDVENYIGPSLLPLVIKVDGLAAGKGVFLCHQMSDVEEALHTIYTAKKFGSASDQVVVEEFLEGPELSFFALCDGKTALPLEPAQDYKALNENGQGPNTGGMGSYCPLEWAGGELKDNIMNQMIQPVLDGMQKRGAPFQGILFAGLILTKNGPKLLEYNVRFGDPETQSILGLLESDLAEIFWYQSQGALSHFPPLEWKKGCSICVVLASAGYPSSPVKGDVISGIDQVYQDRDSYVLHAGTKLNDKQDIVTHGGRVLNVCSFFPDEYSELPPEGVRQEARNRVYQAVSKVVWKDMHFRKDIGL